MSLNVIVAFTLNRKPVEALADATESALGLLRRAFDLGGAKLACGEGECGACTVLVDARSRNACLMPAVDLDGREVLTIEGLWAEGGLDPVQSAFIEAGAVQCGYCTPGMIMQAKYLLMRNPRPDARAIRRGLEGNVCRCTGYAKIIEAVIAATVDGGGGGGE